MNDEGTNSKCLICGQNLDVIEDSIIETTLDNGSMMYAHSRCATGLSHLIEQAGYDKHQAKHVSNLVRNINGKMIITRRDFPNQYTAILLFYSLQGDTPTAIEKLKEWLDLNNLDFSNPNVPIKRLVKNGALAVMVGEDKVRRYFITETGLNELNEYLGTMNEEE